MTADELRTALAELGYEIVAEAGAYYYADRPDQKRRQEFADLVRVLPTTVSRWLTGKLPVPSYIDVIVGLLRENQRLERRLSRAAQTGRSRSTQAA